MKKILFVLMLVSFTLQVKANDKPTILAIQDTAQLAEANNLIARLEEINAMDKSEISSSEKQALRKEVRETNKKLRAIHGGVYISVGAIIIIVLLLIILL